MGRAWVLGDGVSTDAIMPGRFNLTTDPQALARACLCEARPDFGGGVQPGDVLVAGRNFGCGSSREHAPVSIRETGVAAVVAASFARIFARNAVNIGLPVIRCPEAATAIRDGDDVDVDIRRGTVTVNGRTFTGKRHQRWHCASQRQVASSSWCARRGGRRSRRRARERGVPGVPRTGPARRADSGRRGGAVPGLRRRPRGDRAATARSRPCTSRGGGLG